MNPVMDDSPYCRSVPDPSPGPFAVACIAALVLSVGCSDDQPRVRVEVCGDADVPRRLDGLRVSLLDADREPRREAVIELLECPEAEVSFLPQSVSFRPFDGRAWAAVQGLDDGRPVARFERRLELNSEESTSVQLALNRDCRGVSCPPGQTCIGGDCELAPRSPSTPTRCESGRENDTLPDSGDPSDTDVEMDADGMGTDDVGPDASGADVGGRADTGPPPALRLCPGADTGSAGDMGVDADVAFDGGDR